MNSPRKQPKFYRITNEHPIRSNTTDKNTSPEKLAESIVRNNKYVYIDINSDHGLCEMESINAEDADQDTEIFGGKYYLCAVNKLPKQSQKVMDYVYKMQELRKQKQKFKELLKDQINQTLSKRKQTSKNKQKSKSKNKTVENLVPQSQTVAHKKANYREIRLPRQPRSLSLISSENPQNSQSPQNPNKNSVIIYRGMQTKYLKSYLEQKQMDTINAQILQKQKQLIAKYGLTNEFESTTKAKSPIVRAYGKIYLPQIKPNAFLDYE